MVASVDDWVSAAAVSSRRGPGGKPMTQKDREKLPAYAREPFQKQITRKEAVVGKLLEDIQMNRMLRGTHASGAADIIYDPNFESQSSSRDLGAVRTFGSQVGRLDMHRAGTRAAADGTFPNHWFPTKPPNDEFTRPASASSGIKFEKQITRKQDVNGKLLEDIPMTRFLFGANMVQGPEHYDNAYDSMMRPLPTSDKKRIGHGQHSFRKQAGRIPLNRQGTRAAADGIFPSHWEPGAGYTPSFVNKGRAQGAFDRQVGRIDLHLTGMRGAPAKPTLAADFNGGGSAGSRPQSAMAALRGSQSNEGFGRKSHRSSGASLPSRPQSAMLPASMNKHTPIANFNKQLTREQWASRPIRT